MRVTDTLYMNTNTTTAQHIGRMNILAISGGRIQVESDTTIALPVRYGYWVRVTYNEGSDLYSVYRIFTRGLKVTVKGEVHGLYADQVGDAAYRASCFRDEFGEAKVA